MFADRKQYVDDRQDLEGVREVDFPSASQDVSAALMWNIAFIIM